MGSLVHASGEQLSEHCVWPIIYTERWSMNDTDVPDVFFLLTFFVWPPEGDMQQWIVKTQLSGAETEYAVWGKISLETHSGVNHLVIGIFNLSISVPARHMMQGSRPPKISQMTWSVSFDSTLLCIALSTLWLADQCLHVSEWTTPWLRLWWAEFWQRMDNMRLCSWEQVRHNPFFLLVSWNSVFNQQMAVDYCEFSNLLIPLWSCC